MKTSQSTYPLRLPRSVKAEVARLAKDEGISVNQFVATAVAEKLAVMNTANFFAERRARADFAAFDKLMQRRSGEAPQPDDSAKEAISRGKRRELMKLRGKVKWDAPVKRLRGG